MSKSLLASFEEAVKENETLNTEEDTSSATGEAEENETEEEEDTSNNESESLEDEEDEESVEALKARLEKAENDRDNYRQGMLTAKGKQLSDENIFEKKEEELDVNEKAVLKVLAKREEQKAMQNIIDSKHKDYIPELTKNEQFREIIGFLPRNVDTTSYDSIVRSLKLATKMWKEDRGIVDKSPKKDTGLLNTKSNTASQGGTEKKKVERVILKRQAPVTDWYK